MPDLVAHHVGGRRGTRPDDYLPVPVGARAGIPGRPAGWQRDALPKGKRRQTESDRMMGNVKPGSKSLLETCVVVGSGPFHREHTIDLTLTQRVADVVHDIEEFGDLPQYLLDRLSQILSKKRVITSRTIDLFLKPDVDRIAIYDCGSTCPGPSLQYLVTDRRQSLSKRISNASSRSFHRSRMSTYALRVS